MFLWKPIIRDTKYENLSQRFSSSYPVYCYYHGPLRWNPAFSTIFDDIYSRQGCTQLTIRHFEIFISRHEYAWSRLLTIASATCLDWIHVDLSAYQVLYSQSDSTWLSATFLVNSGFGLLLVLVVAQMLTTRQKTVKQYALYSSSNWIRDHIVPKLVIAATNLLIRNQASNWS